MNKYVRLDLGCNANIADGDSAAASFSKEGWTEVDDINLADCVLVMTCGFSHERQNASLKQIQRVLDTNPSIKIFVSGCLPGISPELLLQFQNHIQICSPIELHNLKPLATNNIKKLAQKNSSKAFTVPLSNILKKSTGHSSAKVRVSRGCRGVCSYCAIPAATGPLKSLRIKEIMQQVQTILADGIKKIILSGEDVGAYGRDIHCSLGELLSELLTIEQKFEIVIESINPNWLVFLLKNFPKLLSDSRISNRWYIPIQSGSDSVLRKMRRPYTKAQLYMAFSELRKIKPDAYLVTDIIVGHPGESEAEFQESIDFIRQVSFDYIEVMKFDSVQGTSSSKMESQLSHEVKLQRMAQLLLAYIIERQNTDMNSKLNIESLEKLMSYLEVQPINVNIETIVLQPYLQKEIMRLFNEELLVTNKTVRNVHFNSTNTEPALTKVILTTKSIARIICKKIPSPQAVNPFIENNIKPIMLL